MTTKLLTYESKLLERDEEIKANKVEKPPSKRESSKGDKSGGNKSVCTYKPCGKTGHAHTSNAIHFQALPKGTHTLNVSLAR